MAEEYDTLTNWSRKAGPWSTPLQTWEDLSPFYEVGTLMRIAEALEGINAKLGELTPSGKAEAERKAQHEEARAKERRALTVLENGIIELMPLPKGIKFWVLARGLFEIYHYDANHKLPGQWQRLAKDAMDGRVAGLGPVKAAALAAWVAERFPVDNRDVVTL